MTTILGAPPISQQLLADLDRVGRKHHKWTVQAYFELDGTYLVEYNHGTLEILPMPTISHQRIAARLFTALHAAAAPGGEVLFAGTRVKIAEDAFREPDLLYIPPEAKARTHREYTEGAALVMEVVSDSNRSHDLRTKRRDYAEAGIPEYWIVDPDFETVIVLTLEGAEYAVHGEFRPGSRVTSKLLPGLSVDVTALFAST